jgi:hypothetical protein
MKPALKLDFCEDTAKLKKDIEVGFLKLGERLQKIRDERMFEGRWDSFEEYLDYATISPGTASKLINIYQRFFLEWEIDAEKLVEAGGWSVVATLLPICKSKKDAKDWLSKANILSRSDLEKDIKEFRTGKPMSECLHSDSYILKVCRTCGHKERIYNEED